MNDIKKHAVALTIIALLIFIKFIFVPILDWQDNVLADIALQERKIAKIELLMESKELLSSQEIKLDKRLTELNKRFYSLQNSEAFKRAVQKNIENELKSYELKIKNIGWKTTIEHSDAPLTQYSVNYSFSGQGENVVDYILAIDASDKYSELAMMNVTFSKQRKGRLGRLSGRLQRVFYMSKLAGTDAADNVDANMDDVKSKNHDVTD